MPSSSEFSDPGRFSGQRSVKSPSEKSSFSQTCSLLSQYLKEKKGSFGDLSLGINCNVVEPNSTGTRETFRQTAITMNLFPEEAGFSSSDSEHNIINTVDSSSSKGGSAMEPESAQMTIFYAGQVIVFNNFSADKAKEIMQLASKCCSPKPHTSTLVAPNLANNPNESSVTQFSHSGSHPIPCLGNNLIQDRLPQRQTLPLPQPPLAPQRIVSNLRMSRKHSLQRFLEKRKDRITARAPFQLSKPESAPQKPAESKSWLGLLDYRDPILG
ncbi:Tify domain [Dillenia turbinata]|uniref:Protein TIFY n=1 Tax=Dillenia turbinata TaxID=194707 RepID=A0AAN8W4P4_9MAGN